jgi:subtilisin family serine protease
MPIRHGFVVVFLWLTAVGALSGCAGPQPKRADFVARQDTIFLVDQPYIVEEKIAISRWPSGTDQPIAGRVLVKINSSNIANTFRTSESRPELFPSDKNFSTLLRDIGVVRSENLGFGQDGRRQYRLVFRKQTDLKAATEKLRSTPFKIIETKTVSPRRSPIPHVVIESPLRRDFRIPVIVAPGAYPRLKSDSALIPIFQELNVKKLRRVFRMTEKRVSGDLYRVVSMETLLGDAKDANPTRTARAYPDIIIAENMENWFVLHLDADANLDSVLERLRDTTGIDVAQLDFPVVARQDPRSELAYQQDQQWALNNIGQGGGQPGFDINIDGTWSTYSSSDASVVVAVLDTGFKEDLDELAGRLWTNLDPAATDPHGFTFAVDIDGVPLPDKYFGDHGTNVAGVIAADSSNGLAMAGSAGLVDVRLMNLRLGYCSLDQTLSTGWAEIAEALAYAVLHQADIANMSIGGRSRSEVMEETVSIALDAGLIMIASAGNDAIRFTSQFSPHYPSQYNGVISVGGVTKGGTKWPGSNYGVGLDFVAPAAGITTISFSDADDTTADLVGNLSGTSYSAGFTSGVAAIILSKYPSVTAPYIHHWFRATARDMLDPLWETDPPYQAMMSTPVLACWMRGMPWPLGILFSKA